MLQGKKAYLVVPSGGTELGSDYDQATPCLKLVLGFVGITDVEIIAAAPLSLLGEVPLSAARKAIHSLAVLQ